MNDSFERYCAGEPESEQVKAAVRFAKATGQYRDSSELEPTYRKFIELILKENPYYEPPMNAAINSLSPAELEELFFGPPREPELPAKRWPYHNGRRWKLETQGRADRRARRRYRAAMTWHYRWMNGYPAFSRLANFDAQSLSNMGQSFYDFIMRTEK